jgi:hypothetical protein
MCLYNKYYKDEAMKKKTRGILEELSSIGRKTYSDEFIQTTGSNLIESAINLLTKIHETYPEDVATDLERRFLNAIRGSNPRKFRFGVEKIIESKKK